MYILWERTVIFVPITPARFVPYEAKTILLKVYSYENKNMTGALSNLRLDHALYFDNTAQMLFGIEQIIEAVQFPQANMEARSFAQVSDAADGAKTFKLKEDDGKKTPVATFKLNVMFRQNASWQGSLVWLDDNSEVQFRSVLELVQLFDSVL